MFTELRHLVIYRIVIKRHGKGTMKYADGRILYDGEWFRGKMSGRGTCTFGDGTVYEGEFREDQPHGEGKVKYANGNLYEGQMRNDQRHGKGKMISKLGTYYGDWVAGIMHGQGTFTTDCMLNEYLFIKKVINSFSSPLIS